MRGDVSIVEDGIDHAERRPSSIPPWVWLSIGAVFGFALGVVSLGSDAGPSSQGTETELFPTLDTPVDGGESEGIGQRVNGFPDTLVAVVEGDTSLEHVMWPVDRDPIVRRLPRLIAGEARFDQLGRYMVIGTAADDSGRMTVRVGRPTRLQEVVTDVTGFAWHDSRAGILSYTEDIDGEWHLWVVDASLEPELILSGGGLEGTVAAWGDWGWLIQESPGTLVELTPSGEVVATFPGTGLDSHPDGSILIEDLGLGLVSAGDTFRLDIDIGNGGSIRAAEISPNGRLVALSNRTTLAVAPLEGGDLIEVPVSSESPDLAWTSDSRFVVSTWAGGVVIVDLEQPGRPHTDLITKEALSVATVPLRDR